MAEALGLLLFGTTSSISIGTSIALTTAGGALTAAGTIFNIGAALALNALVSPKPNIPTAEDVVQNFQSAVAPRQVHMGRGKIGGVMMFPPATKDGKIHILLAQMHGKIGARTKHFLDGREVQLWEENRRPYVTPAGPGGGFVGNDEYQYGEYSMVKITFRDGDTPSPPLTELYGVVSEWDADHRLDGVATVMITANAPPASRFNAMFPNRTPTYSCEGEWHVVKDIRTGAVAHTENPIAHLYDYMTSPDGLGWSDEVIDLDSIKRAMDVCDEELTTSTGTQKRYRISGTYTLVQTPAEVIKSILSVCDGELYRSASGKYEVRVGKEISATITLDSKHLVSVLDWSNGRSLLLGYSSLKPTYTDVSLGFVSETIDPWVDDGLVSRYRQEIVGADPGFINVPDHIQARRLSKIKTKKDNPLAEGVLRFNLHGLRAIGQDFVNVKLDFDIEGVDHDGPVKVRSVRLVGGGGESGTTAYVDVAVAVLDPTTYDWTIDEEGRAPEATLSDDPSAYPSVTNFVAVKNAQIGAGTTAGSIAVAWDKSEVTGLAPHIEYSVDYADGRAPRWKVVPVAEDADGVTIDGILTSFDYEVSHQWVSSSGVFSARTILSNVDAGVATRPVAPPTGLTATAIGGGTAQIQCTASTNEANWKTNIYRDGVLIDAVRTPPGGTVMITDAPGVGSFAYTVQSLSVAQEVSTTVATTPATTILT